MMQTCPYCGSQTGYGYNQLYCNRCGNPLPMYGQGPAPYQPPPQPIAYYIPDGPVPQAAAPLPETTASKRFKKMLIVVAAILIVTLVLALAAYELTRGPASPLEGKWELDGGEFNGDVFDMSGTITFDRDGTYRMSITGPERDSGSGTWKDLGYGRMTIDGDSGFYELDGDRLRFGVNQDSDGDSWSFDCTKA